jgi:hypothetical protein
MKLSSMSKAEKPIDASATTAIAKSRPKIAKGARSMMIKPGGTESG